MWNRFFVSSPYLCLQIAAVERGWDSLAHIAFFFLAENLADREEACDPLFVEHEAQAAEVHLRDTASSAVLQETYIQYEYS